MYAKHCNGFLFYISNYQGCQDPYVQVRQYDIYGLTKYIIIIMIVDMIFLTTYLVVLGINNSKLKGNCSPKIKKKLSRGSGIFLKAKLFYN